MSYAFQLECADIFLACGPQGLQEFDPPLLIRFVK